MSGKVERDFGDNSPINFLVSFDNSGPVDLSLHAVQITIKQSDGTPIVTNATAGLSIQPSQTFTADPTTSLLTCYENGLKYGDQVLLSSTGTLPGPLAQNKRYYVIKNSDTAFGLAATPGGAQIPLTDAGSGVHSVRAVGSGQFVMQSTYAVGLYDCWIILADTTTAILPPKQHGFTLQINPLGS